MAGDANPGTVDDYSSTEETISPIMSQDEFNMLQGVNTVSMISLNMDHNLTSIDPNLTMEPNFTMEANLNMNSGNLISNNTNLNIDTDLVLFDSRDPFWPEQHPQSVNSFQGLVSTSLSNEAASELPTYTQLNESQLQGNQSHYIENNRNLEQDERQSFSNQLYQNFKGKYDFDIIHKKQDLHITKSTPWTYSTILNKLYVSFNIPCPIQFHTSSEPPFGTVIRAMPYFMEPQHANQPVRRCLNHMRPGEPSNQGFAHIEHIIRCDCIGASYQCSADERFSVVVPYTREDSSRAFPNYFSYFFTCFTSCIGGMNRRPIAIVFSLEHGNQILGQKYLEVRVCACPGRDRMKNEKQYLKLMENNKNKTNPTENEPTEVEKDNMPDSLSRPPPEKKSKPSPTDELITVSVQFQAREPAASLFQGVLNCIRDYVTGTQTTLQLPNLNLQLLTEQPEIKPEI